MAENFEDMMGADLYTLVDEDGVEQTFELMDTYETDEGELYYALVPYYENPRIWSRLTPSLLFSAARKMKTARKLSLPLKMTPSTRGSVRSLWTDFPRLTRNNIFFIVFLQISGCKINRNFY